MNQNTGRAVLLKSEIPGWPVRRGKVRDVYDLGDKVLVVASDRISAFDWVLPTGVPDKGRVLTQLSAFWFERVGTPHHLLSTRVEDVVWPAGFDPAPLEGRIMLARKAEVAQVECVVRGYLAGSGWKDYQRHGAVCGVPLRAGLRNADRLPAPIFTPATKAESGHDENISFEEMVERLGRDAAETLRDRSLEVYRLGAEWAEQRGVVIADTKFEWGRFDGEWILVDEVLTPDSSRFWGKDEYQPGANPPSFDKQFVRDWLETSGWDKESTPPELPADVVQKTREKYIAAYEILTGERFPWA